MKRKDICTIILALIALFGVGETIHMAARGIVSMNCEFVATLYKTCCMAITGIIGVGAIAVLSVYSFVESRAEDQDE